MILGIDVGLSGGLALYGDDGLSVEEMPAIGGEIDASSLYRYLNERRTVVEMAYLEKVHWMPGRGASSMLSFGIGVGTIRGLLTALEIPYTVVAPAVWMKAVHAGIPEVRKGEKKDTKAMSVLAAGRLFPGFDFRASLRAKKAHEGMVEAALIAYYGATKGTA